MSNITVIPVNKCVEIPVYSFRISAGIPVPIHDPDYVDRKIYLPDFLVPHPGFTHGCKVSGDSMFPAMKDGDLLICDRYVALNWKPVQLHDKAVVVYINGEFMVKRFKYIKGKIHLTPDNPDYETIIVNKEFDNFELWGLVTQVISNPNY